MLHSLCFFFFKQKTAYEVRLSLVGSEMCIRDRTTGVSESAHKRNDKFLHKHLLLPFVYPIVYAGYAVSEQKGGRKR